ncbi:DUF4442 domain-containing protein [Pseudomonas sp.]|uniref:DUF4442 domain-containing protein n=1 Tax=Pseudomonas sp. TaxID=306 RepID=UPI0027323917|nr:DUF4442 domain-containing protein [Pseudomonas sp.]MDP3814897.1 DUF4442 domain-containing protein [Pseudomonas sp.]
MSSNRLSRIVAKLHKLPAVLHSPALSLLFGSQVKFAGTAKVRVHELTQTRAVMSLANKRKVQNHIQGVHAAAMALLAESATGFLVGMNVPDDKLPLIKSLKVDYLKRAVGGLRAEASLTPEQIQAIHSQDKGEVLVAVQVTDDSGNQPIQCEMLWAWVSKKR